MELAVIKTGGKQFVVAKGDVITIEKLPGDLKKGDAVTFSEVLMTDDGSTANIGTPTVKGAKVEATIEAIGRAKKIDVVKYKAKSRYLKRRGHKQPEMKVKISSIG
ncbi:MAG: ribosomal protein L21 [Parcubacteria bacterium C7867-001]|nr:MAG: ribosomal protein L21 [Parcubacteria bacterium C7867-001]